MKSVRLSLMVISACSIGLAPFTLAAQGSERFVVDLRTGVGWLSGGDVFSSSAAMTGRIEAGLQLSDLLALRLGGTASLGSMFQGEPICLEAGRCANYSHAGATGGLEMTVSRLRLSFGGGAFRVLPAGGGATALDRVTVGGLFVGADRPWFGPIWIGLRGMLLPAVYGDRLGTLALEVGIRLP